MSPFSWKLVTLDVDGTITRGHGWAFIASALGRSEEFSRLNAKFLAGGTGEKEHLRGLLALARGHSATEIGEILERSPRIAGIRETIAALHARGARVA
ncbi:MAG: hypothetical protein L3K13_04955, partial [Thermoplasmata archaeon]|nr:hypothetical protein [Thermoplasmata archaeon]